MIYHVKGSTKGIGFYDFILNETFFDDIKPKKLRFADVEKNKSKFELKLINKWIGGNKSNKQLNSETGNIVKFCKSQKEIIKFCNDYFKMVHKAAYDSKDGKGLKILTNANGICTSNGNYIWKLTKRNLSDHIFFVLR